MKLSTKILFTLNYLYFKVRYFYNEVGKNSSFIPSNHSYGHEYWIKKYSSYKRPIMGLIEHGMHFGEIVICSDDKEYEIKKVLTYGDYGENINRKASADMKIYKIGPRIAYVDRDENYYNQLKSEKKVLTVFPQHSTSDIKYLYDANEFVKIINDICIENKIEEKRCCINYHDFGSEYEKIFKENNFTIVSANEHPLFFLPRLKAIIESSDLTVSNSLGTNLGYCIYLNVPQIIVNQKITNNKNDIEKKATKENETPFELETKKFAKVFNRNNATKITKEQYDLCNYYWGFDCVKSKEEMRNLLNEIKNTKL